MKLILLSGFMGDPADWTPFTTALEKLGSFDVAILAPPYRDQPLAEPFILCGYSMGGRVAISLATTPGCRGVISVSSSPGLRDSAERQTRAAADERIAQRFEAIQNEAEFREFLNEWWSQPVFGGSTLDPAERERLIASRLKMNPRDLAAHLREFGPAAMPSFWNEWTALKIPKLAIAGERDPKYVQLAKEMGDHRVIGHAGHQIPMEQPERLAQVIRDFFSVSSVFSVVNSSSL